MAISFDDDSVGAVLEYCFLFPYGNRFTPTRANDWEATNVRRPRSGDWVSHSPGQEWIGPAVTKGHLIDILKTGRDENEVRRAVGRAMLQLANKLLVEPWVEDQANYTAYLEITELGRTVYDEGTWHLLFGGLPAVVRHARNRVTKIHSDQMPGVGAGFLVGDSQVLTAGHVVEDLGGAEIIVEFDDGNRLEVSSSTLHKDYPSVDLAEIHLQNPIADRQPLDTTKDSSLFEEVAVLGYPYVARTTASNQIAASAEISAFVTLQTRQPAIILARPLHPGFSGGPVLNRFGKVIGVVSQRAVEQVRPEDDPIKALGFSVIVPIALL